MEKQQDQAAQLVRMRRIATGLLLAMAVLFVVSRLLEPRLPGLSFVTAFAEAAMVGALADWFAVTALFRSPLGLPIPHTAIIPRNKDRIGESLSDFLEHNFMTREIIDAELRPIDFSGIAAAWITHPDNSRAVAGQLAKAIPSMLRAVEDEDVRQFMQSQFHATLQTTKFAPLLAEILSMLMAKNQHRAMYDHFIGLAARALEHNKPYIRWKIHESSPRWLPKAVDDKLYERLVQAVQSTLDEMRDEDSEWRMRFQIAVENLGERLKESPEYEARISGLIQDALNHPLFRHFTVDMWHQVKARLVADAAAEDSHIVVKLNGMLHTLGNDLLRDENVQAKLNNWIRSTAVEAIVKRRESIADLAARVIKQWDAETVSRKLELHVGKDLQYIRINGTLVGGMVGLLLHAVALLL